MIALEPIAHVRNARRTVDDDEWGDVVSEIVLAPGFDEESLAGLEAFSHAEVIFHFDRVDERKIVTGARHPRNDATLPRVGIFAQRGKNRPNRLGLATVRILAREGRVLRVLDLDAIDGTPVVDIKPVLREFLPAGDVRQPDWTGAIMRRYRAVPKRDGTVHASIRPVAPDDAPEWRRMRDRLWPVGPEDDHGEEIARYFAGDASVVGEAALEAAVFVADRGSGRLAGFVEAALRPFVEDCEGRPVGYVEGWWVDEDARRGGIGASLLAAAEAWARDRGCSEMASDCPLENEPSRRAHVASGYEEIGRDVRFRKSIALVSSAIRGNRSEPR